jgi:hypothetical protein
LKINVPLRLEAEWLVFTAEDGGRDLLVRVTLLTWEQIQAKAPAYMDADDRRDFALGLIEARAKTLQPQSTAEGWMVTVP